MYNCVFSVFVDDNITEMADSQVGNIVNEILVSNYIFKYHSSALSLSY